jgi:hypothetical protein
MKAGYKLIVGIKVLAVMGALAGSIFALTQWNKLNDLQRSTAILALIGTVAGIVKNVPGIVTGAQGVKWPWSEQSKLEEAAAAPDATKSTEDALVIASDDEVPAQQALKATSELVKTTEQGGQDLVVEGTVWTERFEATVGLGCKIIGAVAAVGLAVVATIQFVQDMQENKPTQTKALDGIIMAATAGSAICVIAGLFTAASFVPIIGAVFAIIGIIATLIAMFAPPPQEPTPVDKFMTDHLVPAARGGNRWILDAPAGWNKDTAVPQVNAYTQKVAATV